MPEAVYSYNNQGNLRQVKLASGNTIDYAIDPAGRRTGKRVNGQLQWQLVWLDNLRPIAKLKADNTLEAVYYYGGKPNVPEAMDKGGKTYRIVSDHNGSVRLVIDASSGEVAQQMDYDVWGQVINDTNPGFQPFGFAGGLYDPDTSLTRFGARDYDTETGRWTAKDPILFNGGDSNLYGYVLGDPVDGVDPNGEGWKEIVQVIGVAIGLSGSAGYGPNKLPPMEPPGQQAPGPAPLQPPVQPGQAIGRPLPNPATNPAPIPNPANPAAPFVAPPLAPACEAPWWEIFLKPPIILCIEPLCQFAVPPNYSGGGQPA